MAALKNNGDELMRAWRNNESRKVTFSLRSNGYIMRKINPPGNWKMYSKLPGGNKKKPFNTEHYEKWRIAFTDLCIQGGYHFE